MNNIRRLLVCFKCNEGIYIFENNPIRNLSETLFYKHHSGHPVQIVNESDIEKEKYKILNEKDLENRELKL